MFTYDLGTPTDLTRVRFHIGDTNAESPRYSDEELTFLLSENGGDVPTTVIAAIRGLIARLAGDPNFTADWLTVDIKAAIDGLKSLLKEKAKEFDIALMSASFTPTFRTDSDQTAAGLDYASAAGDEWA